MSECVHVFVISCSAGGCRWPVSIFCVVCVVCNSRDSAPRSRLKDKENNFPFKGLLIGRPTFHCPAPHTHTITQTHTEPKHSCKLQPLTTGRPVGEIASTQSGKCSDSAAALIKAPSVQRRCVCHCVCVGGWHA